MIRIMVKPNWNTTSSLRNRGPPVEMAKPPLRTAAGFSRERCQAGYSPANNPVTRKNPNKNNPVDGERNESSEMFLPDKELKKGRPMITRIMATIMASAVCR